MRPCLYLLRTALFFVPVFRIHFKGRDRLYFVCAHHMVKNHIRIDLYSLVMKRFDCTKKLILCTILGSGSTLLVKFAEVV